MHFEDVKLFCKVRKIVTLGFFCYITYNNTTQQLLDIIPPGFWIWHQCSDPFVFTQNGAWRRRVVLRDVALLSAVCQSSKKKKKNHKYVNQLVPARPTSSFDALFQIFSFVPPGYGKNVNLERENIDYE